MLSAVWKSIGSNTTNALGFKSQKSLELNTPGKCAVDNKITARYKACCRACEKGNGISHLLRCSHATRRI
jgi:hypothetical protein